ncbi:hypothetical protein ES703_26640 [subsurface metagenome]|nr:hypothetical protein [bacterium]
MKKTTIVLKIVVLLPCLLFLLSCDKINPDHASSSILLVTRINGYTATGDSADFLQSDVYEGQWPAGTIVADIITATLEARLKEPETIGLGPSYQNRIVLHSYDVTYRYIDSTVGVSGTPADFRGEMSVALDIDSLVDVSFVIIREQAKAEIPLSNIINTNELLEVVATVTFYGDDIAGNPVQATASLTIYIADYADA